MKVSGLGFSALYFEPVLLISQGDFEGEEKLIFYFSPQEINGLMKLYHIFHLEVIQITPDKNQKFKLAVIFFIIDPGRIEKEWQGIPSLKLP